MIKGVLIVLDLHLPSKEATEFLNKVKIGMEGVEISPQLVTENRDLKRLRKKYKFKDLPCLKIEKDGEIYYRDKLYDKLREIKRDAKAKRARKGVSQAVLVSRTNNLAGLRSRHDSGKRSAEERDRNSSPGTPRVVPDVRTESGEDS